MDEISNNDGIKLMMQQIAASANLDLKGVSKTAEGVDNNSLVFANLANEKGGFGKF